MNNNLFELPLPTTTLPDSRKGKRLGPATYGLLYEWLKAGLKDGTISGNDDLSGLAKRFNGENPDSNVTYNHICLLRDRLNLPLLKNPRIAQIPKNHELKELVSVLRADVSRLEMLIKLL